MEEANNKKNDYEREPVPLALRKGWVPLSLVWIAIGIDISSMLLGAQLGSGMNFWDAIWAVVLGSLLLGIMGAVCAYMGAATGLSTAMITRYAFGEYGARLISAIIGISLLGWFGVQAGFFAQNAQTALSSVLGIEMDQAVLSVIGGLLMMSTAIYGYRALEKLSSWAVPLMVILIVTSIVLTIQNHPFSQMAQTGLSGEPLSFGMAVSLVIGIFVVGTIITPDVARWARTRKDAMLASFVGFFVGNSFMIVVAIILSKAMGTSDLTTIFLALGLGIPAILVITLAQWTTNTSNLYSSSLGFSVVFSKTPKVWITLIAGLFATALAYMGIYDRFITFLSFITMLIAPVGGICIAEYYFVNRAAFAFDKAHRMLIARSLVSWLLASFIAYCTTAAPDGLGLFHLTTVPALDGFLCGVLFQVAFGVASRRKQQAEEAATSK